MPFLDRNIARHDPFSKVLFASVLIHYAIFFILFGNPFLILNDENDSEETERSLEVRLLAPPKNEQALEEKSVPFPKPGSTDAAQRQNLALSRDNAGDNATAEGQSLEQANLPPTSRAILTGQIGELHAPMPPPAPPQKTVRKLPPNMSGPEDCLLKVVGMVCPSGTVECISAYKAFCASLPK